MTHLNPKPIIDKCEADGLDLVKHKLATNAYAKWKLPVVREWIKSKEAEARADALADPETGEIGGMDAEVVANGETYMTTPEAQAEATIIDEPETATPGPEVSDSPGMTVGGETPVGATIPEIEADAVSEDADREMVGDDAGLVDDIGNK